MFAGTGGMCSVSRALPTKKCGGLLSRYQTHCRCESRANVLNPRRSITLRPKKFLEEILAACRQQVNAVFNGKIAINGQSRKLAQPAES
jgi:hypothetical protein